MLETVSGPEMLGEVHQVLNDAWAQHINVPTAIRTSIATAAAEIAANIVQHADGGRPVPIRMEVEVHAHQVTVAFTDEGNPASVDLDALNLPDALAKGGRGLALASAVLERLSYHRDESGNHWTLQSRRFG